VVPVQLLTGQVLFREGLQREIENNLNFTKSTLIQILWKQLAVLAADVAR